MAGARDDRSTLADLEQAQRIHPFCEEFEARWREGGDPRIEESLERADERDRGALRRELLLLEVEIKRARGEATSHADYRTRFPDAASDIVDAFAQAGPPPGFAGGRLERGRALGPRNSATPRRCSCPADRTTRAVRSPRRMAHSAGSASTRCSRKSRAVEWAWSTRRGKRESSGWWR